VYVIRNDTVERENSTNSDLVEIQETQLDENAHKPTNICTLFCRNNSANYHSRASVFLYMGLDAEQY